MFLPLGWNRRGKGALGAARRSRPEYRKVASRPRLESLEERALLATYVSPTQGFLAGAQPGKPLDIAMNYLANHQSDYGMSGQDLSRLFITDNYTDSSMGVTHIYLRQGFNGVPIQGSDVNVNIGPNGEVINIGGGFIPGLGAQPSAQSPPPPTLSAQQAIAAAAASLKLPGSTDSTIISPATGDPTQAMVLQAPGVSLSDIHARLEYVVASDGSLKLSWEVPLDAPRSDYWDPFVDANTGEITQLNDWTDHYQSSFNVLSLDNHTRSPDDGPRAIVFNPPDTVGSPAGWNATTANGTPTYTITRGNNAFAYEDHANANQPGFSPDGGANLNFDFPLNLSLDPTQYVGAAVTDEFYWVNIEHDVWYHYGFDEKAGNFQVNNFGKGGAGNDEVLAEAQDGGGTDNANFATPPDGTSGRMQMYLFDLTNPQRDGDMDPEIILHEFGHGLSNRLTGGPSDANALNAIQSGGMGEGWSDFWSLWFLVHPGDNANTARPTGTYVLGQPTSGGGVRQFPYSFDMNIDPHTIADFNKGNEVHDTGEIWTSALWDMNWLLIDKYGYDNNLYTGTGGNNLAAQLILEGMMLQPANPSFKDARDAILRADQVLNGGLDQFEIWTAFARRGMGLSFNDGGSSSSTSVTAATDIPKFMMVKAQPIPAATELTALNNVQVAALSDPAGQGATSDYKATIDWGDGTVTPGTIVLKAAGDKVDYKILGTHTYQIGGPEQIKISVVKTDGSDASTDKETIVVKGLPMSATGTSLSLKEGQAFANALAHFTDTAPISRPASFYTATINFGDGTNAVGTIVPSQGGGFDVFDGSQHVYGGGDYSVTIAIAKPGLTVTAQTQASVEDSPLFAAGLAIAPIEGSLYKAPLATFTDADPRVPGVTNYFATIDWGDGSTPTTGKIIPNPLGAGYAVVGDHPYGVGSYGIIVTIGNYSGGNTAVGLSTADVADAPIDSQGLKVTPKPTAGAPFSAFLATFVDQDPRPNPTSHYTATIDWGDGTKEPGLVVVNEDGGYLVKGSHAYRPGTFPITTTITDVGGSTTIATGSATVPDAPTVLTPIAGVHLPAGTAPSKAVDIASFTTPNLLALPTDYTATVDYGDGTVLTEPIDAGAAAGSFFVRTTKVYDQEGSYPVGITLTSPGGMQQSTGTTIVVDAAPITFTNAVITGTSKTQLTAIPVASFVSQNPKAQAGSYSASINWGDGQVSSGTISANGLGGFAVTGDHRFAGGGTFNVAVTITGGGKTLATVQDVAVIDDLLTPITGGATTSPGGSISTTGLTNSSQPIFTGLAEPFANVQIFVQASGGSKTLAGSGRADGSGHYNITSTTLGDGQYTVTASATDGAGKPSSGTTVLYPTPSRGPLVVDTQGPKVTSARLDARTGKVTIDLSDGGSGLGSGVLNASNFSLTTANGKSFPVTGLTVSPVSPNTNQTVTLTFGTARPLASGKYVLTISAGGVADRAGNGLDERYFVAFPGLYNRAGQDFVASFQTNGKTATQPQQFIPPPEVAAAQKHRLFVRKHFRR